jgi:phosphatidylglycerophosphate synthase
MSEELQNRRPLATRNKRWAQKFAQLLTRTNITPNQISVLSVGFAAAGFYTAYMVYSSAETGCKMTYLLLTAAMIQLRLLCNMMDGLVAVEGGKKSATGDLFNDVPDRAADVLLIMGIATVEGLSSNLVHWGSLAVVAAVLTAYMRTLGSSLGLPADFGGPMAKQHRMFTLTLACVLASVELKVYGSHHVLRYAMIIVAVGGLLTFIRRMVRAYKLLQARGMK